MGMSNVPIIVWRCVEEVERRGLDIIGKYRTNSKEKKKRLELKVFMCVHKPSLHYAPQVCTDSAVRRPRRGYLGKLSRGTHGPWICRPTTCQTSTSSPVMCRKIRFRQFREKRKATNRDRYFFFFSGVLKDYLRELPEPLFTKCLYQMMVDALAVCLPDDPQGNAKLMFSILDCLPKVNRVRISAKF